MIDSRKYRLKFLSLLAAAALAACGTDDIRNGTDSDDQSGSDEDTEEYAELVMGFVPSSDAENITANAQPLADYLEEALEMPVTAEVTTDYVGLVEAMRTGQTEIGFLPAFGYVQAAERGDVEVVAKAVRFGSGTYKAQYNVLADSDLEDFDDLVESEGLVWAFPGYSSTSGYLFPGLEFLNAGIEDLEGKFQHLEVQGHDNAILQLLDGNADFATTFDDARGSLSDEIPDITEQIRIIGYTDPIPNDTVTLYGGMPDDLKQRITEAFLTMEDNEEALQAMHEIYEWDGIEPAEDSEYDIVREAYAAFEDLID
ncbi:phosphonate transport system substrate-binding protein [Alkalibacterium subtropicum]|uniref:Phosphonate transport system substrate-binding protein n=1 Tax=Alkalibacterium subtropicum TaxID=753702 RepID=A0A1I1KUL4_9LACT|nr:phosphonate transport system substrate-binding protein [Alkalibacterium subtropicum]